MKKIQKTRKYFAPQTEGKSRTCDYPGCTKKGEYKAPKDKNLKEYYWFCLDHVQEYNKKWNYYDGSEKKEDSEKRRSHMHFKSRVRYNFKDDFGIFGEYIHDHNYAPIGGVYYSREERKYIKIMELTEDSLDLSSLKKQYKKLAKKYHPDANRGDKEMEEKFKQLSTAYNHLLKKLG